MMFFNIHQISIVLQMLSIQVIKIFSKLSEFNFIMLNHEGLGNLMVNDDEVSGTTLDLFSWPERENNI